MKLSLVSLGIITTLLYGEYVSARERENLVDQRKRLFESSEKEDDYESSRIPSKQSLLLQQIREDIRNNQKWTEDAVTELKQQLHTMKLEEAAMKEQIEKLIAQSEQDIKEESQQQNFSDEKQDVISVETEEDQSDEDNDSDVVFDTKIVLKNWMTTYYDSIKDKLLKDIVIPGTHDSGTAAIPEKGAKWSSDGRGVSIPFTQKDEDFSVPWSKTQDLTIKEQLDIGVRFFDFRVSVEEGERLYLSHGLLGEKLSDALSAIAEFCKKYPKELVIIKVKGFTDKQCKKNNGNQLIVKKFKKQLGDLLISRQNVPNLSLTKYSDLIEKGNIVVLFDIRIGNKLNILKAKETGSLMKQALKETDWLFDGECLESHHANTVSTEKLFDFSKKISKEIEKDKKRKDKLFALHWTLTANAAYIGKHAGNEFGIRYMTSKLNGGKLYKGSYSLENLIQQIPRVNIVQHDFIDKNKSAYLIKLNLKSR